MKKENFIVMPGFPNMNWINLSYFLEKLTLIQNNFLKNIF